MVYGQTAHNEPVSARPCGAGAGTAGTLCDVEDSAVCGAANVPEGAACFFGKGGIVRYDYYRAFKFIDCIGKG